MISFNLMTSNTIYVLKACDLYLQSALLLNFQTHISTYVSNKILKLKMSKLSS